VTLRYSRKKRSFNLAHLEAQPQKYSEVGELKIISVTGDFTLWVGLGLFPQAHIQSHLPG
jgi:hypothetical protein